MTLSQLLKKHRISQRALAAEIGYSAATVNKIVKYDEYPRNTCIEIIQVRIDKTLADLGIADKVNWENDNKKREIKMTEELGLSPKAEALFNLHQSPFKNDVRTRDDVYLSAEQRYIRKTMKSAVKNGEFVAIIGEVGSGKTTLKRDLLEGIREDGEKIIIIQPINPETPKLTVAHLCNAIIYDVGQGQIKPQRDMESKARQIKQMLTDSSRAGYSHCILIDEAQDLTVPMLKYLKRFWEFEDGMTRLLGVLLIGQPELQEKLSKQNRDVREVVRRCENVELLPLNTYVGEYLKHKFSRAGLNFTDFFADDAMSGLTALLSRTNSKGTVSRLYPLEVNNAVIAAMNACAEIGQSVITADIFEGV